jgi:hypothetical protein
MGWLNSAEYFVKNRLDLHYVKDGHEKCCCILHPIIDQALLVSISIHYVAPTDGGALFCRSHVVRGLQTRDLSFRATVTYAVGVYTYDSFKFTIFINICIYLSCEHLYICLCRLNAECLWFTVPT